jgi:galactose mutarotase-like enzyme
VSAPAALRARLRCGAIDAEVVADRFLTVTSLRLAGLELLVGPEPLPAAAKVHGTSAGITLMHPWANRLGADRFAVAGREVRLDADETLLWRDANGVALHGLPAPPGAWRMTAGGDRLTATLPHPGGEATVFPFVHELAVEAIATAAGLRVVTTLRATGADPVPVVFGWHPYLTLPGVPRDEWLVSLPAGERLAADARGLPTGRSAREPAGTAPLAGRDLDAGLAGLTDGAELALGGGGLRLVVRLESGYPAAQVYAPRDAEVLSLEPMTAVTDALRSGRGLRLLVPGEIYRAAFAVEVETDDGAGKVGRP